MSRLGYIALVAAILAWSLGPFYYAIVTSLEQGSALFEPGLVPQDATLANFPAVFEGQPFGRAIVNSTVVAAATVIVSLALALGAAWALGRVRFRGRSAVLYGVLSVTMFPQVAVLAGLFETLRWLGLYNHLGGLVLSYMIFTLPFTTWVLSAFMGDIPRELEEAATIDGAGPVAIVFKVFAPLLAPAMAATGLLAFIVAWNEFLFALSFTLTADARTVPVAIAAMSGASQFELPWGRIMAASVTVTVPLVALVLVFQRRIVAGLSAGAVKG